MVGPSTAGASLKNGTDSNNLFEKELEKLELGENFTLCFHFRVAQIELRTFAMVFGLTSLDSRA